MLNQAIKDQANRASVRDTDTERSMAKAVDMFNRLYQKDLTEEQGWMFMVLLKASRSAGGSFRSDDYADGASYFALCGEAASNERE